MKSAATGSVPLLVISFFAGMWTTGVYYNYYRDKEYGMKALPEKLLRQFVQMVDKLPRPSIYEKHIYYVDFQTFGKQQPTYINLVRDPLERRISGYYYMRFGRIEGNQKEKRTEEERAQTFDDCVLNNMWECDEFGPKTFTMTQFFCGQESICMEPSQMAVERAKENIRRHYAVVGVLEEFSSFLKVLEVVMPQFLPVKADGTSEDGNKDTPFGEEPRIMRQRLHVDYQVYDFIKERFHMQKTQLGIKD
ncbi:UST [Branchiostoma lanceolatum]|uniref:UST protein n=1 Tax=Branchiostoma lanceolatum TaxID=7740 RepID=A0A8J9ZM50_BRALA|nr:UST [Branchiostoma lanceolatum]